MKATKTGQVIGMALEDFDKKSRGSAVMMFVNPGTWVNPSEYKDLDDRIKALEQKLGMKK